MQKTGAEIVDEALNRDEPSEAETVGRVDALDSERTPPEAVTEDTETDGEGF